MKQEWTEMCGLAYTPDAVTDEPKIHGLVADGEAHPPIGGRGGHIGIGNRDPYAKDTEVGDELRGIWVSLDSGLP